MMMFFAEHYGYSVDQTLLVSSASSIRDSLVMASPDQFSEFEYLEQLLLIIVRSTPSGVLKKDWILGQI